MTGRRNGPLAVRVQRATEHRVVPWANGRGTTAEVIAWPPDATEWTWRLSIATVAEDGPFSVFPGLDRHITIVEGDGIALRVDGSPETLVRVGEPAYSFPGDAATTGRLLQGPILDLNLMVRRIAATGQLDVAAVQAGAAVQLPEDARAVAVISGEVAAGGDRVGPQDVVLLDAGPLALTAMVDSVVAIAVVSLR